jgi:hypothetical protein
MKIQPFQLQLHHPNTVAKVWKKLPAESRRELAIALEDKPLVFYANIFDGITVLLRDDVIAANDDRHKLEQLAKNEVDNKKARFIAESIPRASFRYRALGELLGRSSVNLEDALRICEQIPDESKRDYALLRCYLQKKLSDQERNVILDKMSPGFFGFYQRTTMAPGMIMIEENKNSELIDRVLATAITCISLLAVLYSLYSWLDSR